jgi:hypothetical protein
MGATKIMIIRHAEKPDTYDGKTYYGVDATGDIAGEHGAERLVTIGWERTGALVTLFAPPWGPKAPTLATPQYLFASDPEAKRGNGKTDDSGPSHRPYETLTALRAILRLQIDKSHKKGRYDDMVKAALACDGVVLIAWQHEDIPLQAKDGSPGISQCILTRTKTPPGEFDIPSTWPKGVTGARYDLVFVFDRPSGSGPITGFTLFPQRLLAGDEPTAPGYAKETPAATR